MSKAGEKKRSSGLMLFSSVVLGVAAGALAWLIVAGGKEVGPPRLPEPAAKVSGEEKVSQETEAENEEIPAPPQLVLSQAEGRVSIRRDGEREWIEAEEGNVLDPLDSVRTGARSAAVLSAGEHVIELLPATDVRVEELTADLSRFLLGTGMLSATAGTFGDDEPERRLQVEVEGTDVTTATRSGSFRVSAAKDGVVAVGADEGRVEVAARGREVVLRPGEGTLVRRGGRPSEPKPLPESLLLRVAWPEETETNKSTLSLAGRTASGALVFVAGRPVDLDEQGRFEAQVRLREGRNRVRVEGFDVGGNTANVRSPVIVVDRRGSKAKFDTEDLWAE